MHPLFSIAPGKEGAVLAKSNSFAVFSRIPEEIRSAHEYPTVPQLRFPWQKWTQHLWSPESGAVTWQWELRQMQTLPNHQFSEITYSQAFFSSIKHLFPWQGQQYLWNAVLSVKLGGPFTMYSPSEPLTARGNKQLVSNTGNCPKQMFFSNSWTLRHAHRFLHLL